MSWPLGALTMAGLESSVATRSETTSRKHASFFGLDAGCLVCNELEKTVLSCPGRRWHDTHTGTTLALASSQWAPAG